MSTRRRIGVSIATTEAARRQLMQPVPCWEKQLVWATPENTTPGTSLKVWKWVKTDKTQQFSDDEGEADEPLAPLPDEPEVVDGDDDMDQDEPTQAADPAAELAAAAAKADTYIADDPSKPSSPKVQTLSLQPPSLQPAADLDEAADALDASLKPLDGNLEDGVEGKLGPEDVENLDMSVLGPDGTAFEAAHDLSQMEAEDSILGGPIMDDSVDPFAEPVDK